MNYAEKVSAQILKEVNMALSEFEQTNACKIILAGFIGSRMIGLSNSTSDYDVRAIAVGAHHSLPECCSFKRVIPETVDIKVYSYEKVSRDITTWQSVNKSYPSVLSLSTHPLVREDIYRNQIRLASQYLIFKDTSFISEHFNTIQNGLLIIDHLDYEYLRAYKNYTNFLCNDHVSLRKYLYTLYEIFVIYWAMVRKSFCPDFKSALTAYSPPKFIEEIVAELLYLNGSNTAKEALFVPRNCELNQFVMKELDKHKKRIDSFYKQNRSLVYSI